MTAVLQALTTSVQRVLARAEAYPDLKASTNYPQLQDELTNTEDRIAAARTAPVVDLDQTAADTPAVKD